MNHNYYEKINPSLSEFKTWMSSDIEPVIDSPAPLPPWATIGNEECTTNYIFNNIGLRCDDFTLEKPDKHVIFAGDEITLPQGVDIDKGWAYLTYNSLNLKKNNFRNLSYPGAAIAKIVSNLFKYFDKYGNPESIFILTPELIRDIGVMRDLGVFKTKIYYQYTDVDPKRPEHNLMAEPLNLPIHLLGLKYLQQMRYLEQYCKSSNINLYWTSWDESTNIFLNNYKWNYFFHIDEILHPHSHLEHARISESFIKQIKV
jgi:hypothetical protein